jgi:hypothetical protein
MYLDRDGKVYDALHEALGRAPIEEDALLALLVLAFAGQNVSIASGNADGYARLERHAARLIDKDGELVFERESMQQAAARAVLIDVLSWSDSGVVARVAGDAVGADNFLPNMGTEDFLSCLPRPTLEAACKDTPGAAAAAGEGHARRSRQAFLGRALRASGGALRARARQGGGLGRALFLGRPGRARRYV